jgi:hypothetical protein
MGLIAKEAGENQNIAKNLGFYIELLKLEALMISD